MYYLSNVPHSEEDSSGARLTCRWHCILSCQPRPCLLTDISAQWLPLRPLLPPTLSSYSVHSPSTHTVTHKDKPQWKYNPSTISLRSNSKNQTNSETHTLIRYSTQTITSLISENRTQITSLVVMFDLGNYFSLAFLLWKQGRHGGAMSNRIKSVAIFINVRKE